MTEFQRRVVAVLRGLGPGEVVTYGDVAVQAGYEPGASRGVGNVLQQFDGLPWWRVVSASGRLVPGHEDEHARRLRQEGVDVSAAGARPARRRPTPATPRPPRDRTRGR